MSTQRIIGSSAVWLETLDHISRLAPVNRPVLVLGERGTGKELAAERLHYLSPRWDHPLIKVNCATFTESLLESELFGYEPGAFTGATRVHRGRFERAQGGTLLLDELATLSTRVQEKVLRVIEYGEFERLGGQKTLLTDVRIVGATNADLPAMSARGEFRQDLLDRLAFDIVPLPPLRQRREDVPELAMHFAMGMTHELERAFFPGFTPAALEALCHYHWPGNVRELKNVVERSVYRSDGESPISEISIDPFAGVVEGVNSNMAVTGNAGDSPDAAPRETRCEEPAIPDFATAVRDFERNLLTRSLEAARHHQGEAAKKLGLSYDQFRGLYRKHGLKK